MAGRAVGGKRKGGGMCSGSTAGLKCGLAIVNIFYALIAIILIAIASYAVNNELLHSNAVIGGIIASGILLLLICIFGFAGSAKTTKKAHRDLLVVYVVLLSIVTLIQMGVSIALFSLDVNQQFDILEAAWLSADAQTQVDIENTIGCCGYITDDPEDPLGPPVNTTCFVDDRTCLDVYGPYMDQSFKATGGVGFVFALTYVVGVVLGIVLRIRLGKEAASNAFMGGFSSVKGGAKPPALALEDESDESDESSEEEGEEDDVDGNDEEEPPLRGAGGPRPAAAPAAKPKPAMPRAMGGSGAPAPASYSLPAGGNVTLGKAAPR